MCILSVYIYSCTLLKVVGYYDLSVLSMSVMGFQKSLNGVGGWGELYPFFLWIFGIFLTLQSPLHNIYLCTGLGGKVQINVSGTMHRQGNQRKASVNTSFKNFKVLLPFRSNLHKLIARLCDTCDHSISLQQTS